MATEFETPTMRHPGEEAEVEIRRGTVASLAISRITDMWKENGYIANSPM